MLGHRDLTLDDYMKILRRRWWIVLIPAVLGPALAFGLALVLPEKYTSQTLVLVRQQSVPEAYVRSVVTDQLNQRLATMKEQILSRTRLQPIIDKFYAAGTSGDPALLDARLAELRAAITVTPVQSIGGRDTEMPGFKIMVTLPEARLAQNVCREITEMFISENLKVRQQAAMGTTSFLSAQLEEAKRKLDEQDARLAAFKARFIGQLPTQEQSNLNMLMSLLGTLDALTQQISRAQQDKIFLEARLNEQIAAWEAAQAGNNPQTLELQLAALKNQLISLESKYLPTHPDVIRAKNDIQQLEKKIEEGSQQTTAGTDPEGRKKPLTEPVPIQQLRAQIYSLNQNIKTKQAQQERTQEQIRVYQSRVQSSPLIEQQFKELTRDYTTAQDFYNDLLKKRTDSEIAQQLEQRQQGETFQVMDEANLPNTPSFPDRVKFTFAGVGGGFALGFGIVLLMELKDKTMRSDLDVEALLNVPVLAMVPIVGNGSNGKRNGRKNGKPRFLKPGPQPAVEVGEHTNA